MAGSLPRPCERCEHFAEHAAEFRPFYNTAVNLICNFRRVLAPRVRGLIKINGLDCDPDLASTS